MEKNATGIIFLLVSSLPQSFQACFVDISRMINLALPNITTTTTTINHKTYMLNLDYNKFICFRLVPFDVFVSCRLSSLVQSQKLCSFCTYHSCMQYVHTLTIQKSAIFQLWINPNMLRGIKVYCTFANEIAILLKSSD